MPGPRYTRSVTIRYDDNDSSSGAFWDVAPKGGRFLWVLIALVAACLGAAAQCFKFIPLLNSELNPIVTVAAKVSTVSAGPLAIVGPPTRTVAATAGPALALSAMVGYGYLAWGLVVLGYLFVTVAGRDHLWTKCGLIADGLASGEAFRNASLAMLGSGMFLFAMQLSMVWAVALDPRNAGVTGTHRVRHTRAGSSWRVPLPGSDFCC